ncbi:MAG: YceI family protein [Fimbriimonadaceae bacterium]|nr:YceI family protein [Fimbriimonadaceae bacterium]
MKLRITLIPLALATLFAGYVAFHPGVAYAEPHFAKLSTTEFADQASYTIDADHCSISFEITHLGLSQTHGRFNKFSGKLEEDAKDLTKSSVEFTAQIDSIDTAVAARDKHLLTADFFDAAKYPTLTFKSTKVEKTKDGYTVTGDLTMKDKTKSITIPFKHYGPYTLTVGDNSTRVGIVAEPIKIKRSDFGVGGDFKLPDGTEGASDTVIVRISFEAIKDK